MASKVTNYQCPSCTAPLRFDGTSGKLVCDYCESTFTVEEIEALYKEKEAAGAEQETAAQAASQGESEAEAEQMDVRVYSCPSCGAELMCDETTIATSCPYCGNPSVTPGPFVHARKPEFIIPFKCTKEQAVEALKNHYKGKRLLPKTFSDSNHLEEIKGVYVPFWLYDGVADARATFHATRTESHRSGNWEITRTHHFRVEREGNVAFVGIPADGSEKMPDAHMDAIEPFDYSELKPFSTAYLPGFLADKYDVSDEACADRTRKRAENSALSAMQDSVNGYSSCSLESSSVNMRLKKAKYALLPVWLLSTRWNDQTFLFAMNGQTGKLIGDLPVDKGRYWAWFGGMFAAVAAALSIVAFLIF